MEKVQVKSWGRRKGKEGGGAKWNIAVHHSTLCVSFVTLVPLAKQIYSKKILSTTKLVRAGKCYVSKLHSLVVTIEQHTRSKEVLQLTKHITFSFPQTAL